MLFFSHYHFSIFVFANSVSMLLILVWTNGLGQISHWTIWVYTWLHSSSRGAHTLSLIKGHVIKHSSSFVVKCMCDWLGTSYLRHTHTRWSVPCPSVFDPQRFFWLVWTLHDALRCGSLDWKRWANAWLVEHVHCTHAQTWNSNTMKSIF